MTTEADNLVAASDVRVSGDSKVARSHVLSER